MDEDRQETRRGEAEALLRRVFGCPADLAGRILLEGRVRQYAVRSAIVRQGDRVAFFYVVVDGRAHALVYSLEGQPVLLQEYRPGDVFGSVGVDESAHHEADVVAVEALAAFLLESGVLALLAERHGCIGLALLRLTMERLQRTSRRIYEHAALSAAGRVHAKLLELARGAPDLTIRPSPVLSEIALQVSTTRETVSRTVSALERRGIVRRDRGGLAIVAPQRLEEMIL